MRPLNFRLTQIRPYVYSLAIFVCTVLFQAYFHAYDFQLNGLKRLIISEATKDGVSIQKRVNLFYELILVGIAITGILVVILSNVFQVVKINKRRQTILLFLGMAGISTVFVRVLGIKAQLLIYLILVILIFKVICYALSSFHSSVRIFKTEVLSNTILVYGFLYST